MLDNTIAKTNKEKQCYTKHTEERQTAMVLSDVLRCALHSIVCPCWVFPWYCLTFFGVFCITLFLLVGFGYGIVFEERQTIPWPKPTRTNNVMQKTSKNVRQYHGQNQQGQTMLGHGIV
jgi:hypothetical protein